MNRRKSFRQRKLRDWRNFVKLYTERGLTHEEIKKLWDEYEHTPDSFTMNEWSKEDRERYGRE